MIHGRAPYRPSYEAPRLAVTGGTRLVVHLTVNVEEWRYDAKLPRAVLTAPGGVEPIPDVPNYAWYEYGMRVGMWRVADVLRAHDIRATLSVNASVCDSYPSIVERTSAAGWHMMAHGYVQQAMSTVGDERDVVRRSLDRLERATGSRPRGWMGPGLVETFETADILAEEGLDYCCDWGAADDLPFDLHVRAGALLAVPYPIDMNDIVMYGLEKRPDDTLFERGKRHFDRLYRESETSPKVMAIAVHPWIVGTPHRIDYLDALLAYIRATPGVRFMPGGEVVDWFRAATAAPASR